MKIFSPLGKSGRPTWAPLHLRPADCERWAPLHLRSADCERRAPHVGAPTFATSGLRTTGAPTFAVCGLRTAGAPRGHPYICGLRTANSGRPTRAPLQRKKDLPIGQVLFPYICNPSRNFSKIFCSSSVRSRPRSMWSSSPLLRALSCSCLSPLLALSSRMITLTPP